MVDVAAMFTQQFDAARRALSEGDQPAAAESLRSAVLVARSDPGLQRELASALLHLGRVTERLGQSGEAEQLLTESLGVSERLVGMDHPALGPLLNELSRLHIQQSHLGRAEAALERLLGIARAKGEEHPEVATALAGLALVKRRIGDDASAEALYRDALHIREKVLAPDHMVTVVTLEQLSETCAARGNFAEALALLQRALPTREAALGSDHATVKAARARMSALEQKVTTAAAPAPVFSPGPSDPKDLVFLYKPEPRTRRPAPPPAERSSPSPSTAKAAAAPPAVVPASKGPAAPFAAPALVSTRLEVSVLGDTSSDVSRGAMRPNVAHRDVARMDVAHRDVAQTDIAHRDVVRVAHRDVATGDTAGGEGHAAPRPSAAHSPGRPPRRRAMLYASAGVAAVAVAIAGLTFRSTPGGSSARVAPPVSVQPPAAVVTGAARRKGPPPIGMVTLAGSARVDLPAVVTATPTPTAPVVRAERRAPETATAPSEPSAPRVQFSMGSMNLPVSAAMNVDSLVRSSTKRGGESVGLPTSAPMGLRARSPISADDDEPLVRAPKMIGGAPLPRFPEALRSTLPEGEVLVRFEVNDHGRVNVAGMKVIRSDHPLFTEAVRNILPLFRFEPARLPAPESKPVAVWVDLPFKFSAKQ